MKTRVLKKLRKEAKFKYLIDIYPVNETMTHYRIMYNDGKSQKCMYSYADIEEAITVCKSLRRNDVLRQVQLIRYQKTMKRFRKFA